jgi:hypothetical protein
MAIHAILLLERHPAQQTQAEVAVAVVTDQILSRPIHRNAMLVVRRHRTRTLAVAARGILDHSEIADVFRTESQAMLVRVTLQIQSRIVIGKQLDRSKSRNDDAKNC